MTATHAWLEARFAEIRPKAIAALTRQFRDIELAEEAFAASCLKALQVWPQRGRPDDPLAWLLTVGRNAGIDIIRRAARTPDLAAGARVLDGPTDAEGVGRMATIADPHGGRIALITYESMRK